MKKRLLTILLAAAMLLIPSAAFAESGQVPADNTQQVSSGTTTGDETAIPDGWNADRTQYFENGVAVKGLFKAKMKDGVGALFYADSKRMLRTKPGPLTVKGDKVRYKYSEDSGGHKGFRPVSSSDTNDYVYLIGDKEGAIVEPSNGSAKIYTVNGKSYLVQKNGTVRTEPGFVKINGKVHFINEKGRVRTTSGWLKYNGKKYRLGEGGVVRTKEGAFTIDGDRYVIPKGSKDGAIRTKKSIAKAKGKLYLVAGESGRLGKNKAYKIGSKVYHVTKYGVVQVGRHRWTDNRIYFSIKSGNLIQKTVMAVENGKYFLANKGGLVTVNKKFKYKGKYFIASKTGPVKTGLFTWKGTKYFANEKGVLKPAAGIVVVNGKRYFVQKHGVVAINKKVSLNGYSYITDKEGVIQTGMFVWKGSRYYADDKGVLKPTSGIIEYKGHNIFVAKGGVVYVNRMFYWKSRLYASDSNGWLQTGLFKRNGTYYYADADNTIRTSEQIFKYSGSYYYNKKGGGLARNEWVNYGDKHYYAGDSAAFRTSQFSISGYTFNPNSKGEISDEEYQQLFPPEKKEEEAVVVDDSNTDSSTDSNADSESSN